MHIVYWYYCIYACCAGTEVLRQFPETTAVTPASETTHEVQMTSGSGLPPTDQDDESSGLEESSSADSVTGELLFYMI